MFSAACVIRSLIATVLVFASKLLRASSSETIEELRSTVSPTAPPAVIAAVDAPGALFADCPVRAIRAAAASKLSAARFIPSKALERLVISDTHQSYRPEWRLLEHNDQTGQTHFLGLLPRCYRAQGRRAAEEPRGPIRLWKSAAAPNHTSAELQH